MAKQPTETNEPIGQIVDFVEIRNQKLEEKRRKNERVFMNHVLGAYCVTNGNSLHQIEMVDVSEDGCAFQTPFNAEKPWPTTDKDIPVRLYFSQDSYLQIIVNVQNSRPVVQGGSRFTRYGCSVDPTTSTYNAYKAFVQFMHAYGEAASKDNGDVNVFFV